MDTYFTVTEAIIQRIEKLCEQNEISVYRLAKLSGVPQSTLNEIMQGRSKEPKLLTIKKIAKGFNMDVQTFFDDPIFEHIEGVDNVDETDE